MHFLLFVLHSITDEVFVVTCFFLTEPEVFISTVIAHIAKTSRNHDRLHASTSGTNENIFRLIGNHNATFNFWADSCQSVYKEADLTQQSEGNRYWCLPLEKRHKMMTKTQHPSQRCQRNDLAAATSKRSRTVTEKQQELPQRKTWKPIYIMQWQLIPVHQPMLKSFFYSPHASLVSLVVLLVTLLPLVRLIALTET